MQRIIKISLKDIKEIKKRKQKEQSAKIFRRLLAIEMRNSGIKCKDVASIIGVCADTISDWTNIFLAGGIKTLCSFDYEGRRPSVLEPYVKDMKAKVEDESISTILQMKTWLKEEHKVDVEESWLFRFCKKNSVFPIKKLG